MIDPIFIIKQKPSHKNQKQQYNNKYTQLVQQFINRSYGYYTQIFLKKLTNQSTITYNFLLKYNLRKILRQSIKKLLLTDLQIIFLAYYLNLNKWNINHQIIQSNKQRINCVIDKQENDYRNLKLFILLIGYFVKSYISSKVQSQIIGYHLNLQIKNFNKIYQLWLKYNPKQCFHLTPRQLNNIYTQYSKNIHSYQHKKDYNIMVDKILELSTTYSIMPSNNTNNKKIKNNSNINKINQNNNHSPRQKNINNSNSSLIQIEKHKNKRSALDSYFDNKSKYDKSIFNDKSFLNEKSFMNDKLIINDKSSINDKSHQQNKSGTSNNNKKILLKGKKDKQRSSNAINEAVTKYFQKSSGISGYLEDSKVEIPKDNNNPSFLDLNIRSSRLSALPYNLRSNSNVFGSQFF